MLIRDSIAIRITATPWGAAVIMPKDARLNASLRSRFPKARWGATTRSWHIPGKLAAKRAEIWAREQDNHLQGMERAARDAEWDQPDRSIAVAVEADTPSIEREQRRIFSRRAARPSHPMTVNQYMALTHYLQRIGKSRVDHDDAPQIPIARWLLEVDYWTAKRWIDWAREQL